MREIKFRAWHGESCEMVVFDNRKLTCDEYQRAHLAMLLAGDYGNVLMQYTGLNDKNGVEIYEGDMLNICFSSNGAENIHDGIYEACISTLGSLEFRFIKLLWESFGHNQYYFGSDLCERYDSLSTIYVNNRFNLVATVDKYTRTPKNHYPFNDEKELSFSSRYFKVIGNIYENPELLEQSNRSPE